MTNIHTKVTSEKVKIEHQIAHINIYIYVVELKAGPIFAFSSVKNWSIFCFFCSFPLQKEEEFSRKRENEPKKRTHF